MKTNKDVVFEFISQLDICKPNNDGITTEDLAMHLGLQRSNLSAILNLLVEEKKIEKIKGRPVHYRLTFKRMNKNFESLIGFDESLKNSIETAKAAILYPKKLTNVLILGKDGCGKSTFVQSMYDFALENNIFANKSQYLKINCQQYVDGENELDDILFNEKSGRNLFNYCESGLFFIDHIEMLKPKQNGPIY